MPGGFQDTPSAVRRPSLGMSFAKRGSAAPFGRPSARDVRRRPGAVPGDRSCPGAASAAAGPHRPARGRPRRPRPDPAAVVVGLRRALRRGCAVRDRGTAARLRPPPGADDTGRRPPHQGHRPGPADRHTVRQPGWPGRFRRGARRGRPRLPRPAGPRPVRRRRVRPARHEPVVRRPLLADGVGARPGPGRVGGRLPAGRRPDRRSRAAPRARSAPRARRRDARRGVGLDGAGRPRHGRPAPRRRRHPADLPRLLVRDLPRSGVRQPLPRPGARDRPRRRPRPGRLGRQRSAPGTPRRRPGSGCGEGLCPGAGRDPRPLPRGQVRPYCSLAAQGDPKVDLRPR